MLFNGFVVSSSLPVDLYFLTASELNDSAYSLATILYTYLSVAYLFLY